MDALKWPIRHRKSVIEPRLRCGSIAAALTVCLMSVPGLPGSGNPAVADEPIIRFVEGLRERGYFDTAAEYLEATRTRGGVPQDVQEVLDLQLGLTWQQKGASSRVPEDREQALAEAEKFLRKFLTEKAQHPQAALANSTLGELLFERARSFIWKAEPLESEGERLELQQSARNLIDQAKGIYQTAMDQYKAAYDAFPKFIDESKDEDEYRRRQEAESKYLRAWFNFVRCTYERGQTFDKGSVERKNTLIEASQKFEAIHTARRTNQIGLHARLMMGKCFQEQDDVSRALGIYNEMLSHPSENPAVESLKGIAQHYRCICLNDPQKNDFQLVIQEATLWLTEHRQQSTTQTGLGILWEKAIAEEKLAEDRALAEKDKEALLSAALNDCRQVAKYPGPYKETAAAMERRLKLVLGEKDREPRDFSTAFERARGMISQIQKLSDEVSRASDQNDRLQKQAALDNHLTEVGRLLQLALDLRDSDSDSKAVAQARYLLSFVLLRQGKSLDAVILATHCLIHDRKADPDTALNATEIAMAAAVSAWNEAPAKDKDFETRTLRDVCQKILELYPQSSRGGEARMRLGSAYRTMGQPLEAAKWYLQVPESDPQYSSARVSAGQSYWAAWTQKAALAAADPETPPGSPEEMQKWKAEARSLLNQGIELTRKKIGEGAKPSEELVAAEVSLASITNLDGEFPATIERLTAGGENSVVAAIEIPEGEKRPEEGIRSQSFASLTYRLLLRAYVGTQQIDAALQTMNRLERVGGSDILAAYTQLGIELQDELKRLKLAGENERLTQVRSSFEKFLQKVYESRNKSDYNSLLWIGETYYGLGLGVSGDQAASIDYFTKAGDAYSEIIAGNLASADNKNAVLLRLARCRRQQQQFAEALKIAEEILAANPMTIDAQFEAALILSDWAASSDPEKFPLAVQGIKDASGKQTVWGWTRLAKNLEQIVAKDGSSDLKSRFVEARYELSNARRRYARVAQKDADKQRQNALAEISSFVRRYQDLDDVSFAKFDRLHQDLQADLGQAPTPIDRKALMVESVPQATPSKPAEQTAATDTAATATSTTSKPEPESAGWLLPVIGIGLCAGLAGGFFVLIRKPPKRVRIPGSATAPKFSGLNATNLAEAPVLPDSLHSEAPELGNFSGLGGAVATAKRSPPAGGTTRPARPAGVPSAKAPEESGATATQPVAKPRPKPPVSSEAGGARPASAGPAARPAGAAPAAPRPASGAPASTGTETGTPGSVGPGSAGPSTPARPATPRPAQPKPGATAGASPAGTASAKPPVPKTPDGTVAPPRPTAPPAAPRPAAAPQSPAGGTPKPGAGNPPARPAAPRPATGSAPSKPPEPGTKPVARPPGAAPVAGQSPAPAAERPKPKPAPPPPSDEGA